MSHVPMSKPNSAPMEHSSGNWPLNASTALHRADARAPHAVPPHRVFRPRAQRGLGAVDVEAQPAAAPGATEAVGLGGSGRS